MPYGSEDHFDEEYQIASVSRGGKGAETGGRFHV